MRQQYVQAKNRREAAKKCPWAAHIMTVVDGYICFESHDDYKQARAQR